MTATGKLSSDAVTAITAEQRVRELPEGAARRGGEGEDAQTDGDGSARDTLFADMEQAKDEIARLRQAYADLTRSRDRTEEDMAAAQAALSARLADQTDR